MEAKMIVADAPQFYTGVFPWFAPPTLVALTVAYLGVSAVIAGFYVVLARDDHPWLNGLLALTVVAVSGTLALQLWSTPLLWGR